MHHNGMSCAIICINYHVFSYLVSMLSACALVAEMTRPTAVGANHVGGGQPPSSGGSGGRGPSSHGRPLERGSPMQLEVPLLFLKLLHKCINSGQTVLAVQGTTTDVIVLLVETIQEPQKVQAKDILQPLAGRVVSESIFHDSHRPLAEVLSPCDMTE